MNVVEVLERQGYSVETEVVQYLPSQELALQYILYDPTVLGVLLYGGVRGGKSFVGCKAAVHVLEMFPGAHVLLARDTRVNLEATTLKTLWGNDRNGNPLLPYGIYNEKDHNQTKGFINWPNQGFLAMMGLDSKQNIERVKSSEWSLAVLEEVSGIAWKIVEFILRTRMSHPVGPRKVLMTTNTDRGENEVYKFYFDLHTCDPTKHCINCPKGLCQFRRILVNTLENERNLPAQYSENARHLAKSDPRYHAVYMEGAFANVSASIYPQYSERVHIIDLPAGWEPPEHWRKTEAYDHGYGGGASCMEQALVVDDGTLLFWDEMYLEGDSRPDVEVISKNLHDRGITSIAAADPSIANKNQYKENGSTLTSVQALFEDHGVFMYLANNDVSGGIERMRTLLTPHEDHKCPIPGAPIEGLPNQPFIYIARVGGVLRCPNLNRQMKKYKNRETALGEQNQGKWDPVKVDDHAVDPARYMVMGQPLPAALQPAEPEKGTTGWVVKMQLKKAGKSRRGPSDLEEAGGSFRVVS